MAVRLQVPKKASLVRFALHPWGRAFLIAFLILNTLALGVFTFYYVKFAKLIEQKLVAGPFANTSMLFAAPQVIMVNDQLTAEEIALSLRRSGYSEGRHGRVGWYNFRANAIEIFPGPDSYFDAGDGGVLKFSGGKIAQIISLRDNTERTQFQIEPELVTNLFDRNREKRRLVTFAGIPKVLINAVISVEDKRFFQHSGFDPLRILKAVYVDLRERRHAQGASTLSMQLARSFWLTQEKTFSRKASELMITMRLEQMLSKQQIFEYYANQIDLGRRGSFAIRGFGEAAQAYFGKDLQQLSLAEAATLAGLIQRPSFTNPVRWPDRAKTRRNVVLMLMRENGHITDREYALAVEEPLTVTRGGSESTDAPYFVDLVNESLQDQFQEHDFQTKTYRVYTSIDLELQKDASEAVRIGMKEIDDKIRKRTRKGQPMKEAQVALVALDPQTGEIKALIGGRDYGLSQLNRAQAKRQPGSVFKPFVYAAALNTALGGGPAILTPASTLMDEPTTFYHDERPYNPNNYKSEFHGQVTMRQALTKSMNIPTVKLAEIVGYRTVVDLARNAGLNMEIRPTPAVALGAYDVTPIEIAGAYSMYANGGVVSKPQWIKLIRSQNGSSIYEAKPVRKKVLDPRINYLMVQLLEEVLRSGTGAGVRSRGFTLPAGGKTGTSRDGWFAGFTSRLVCAVWVGFDDGSDLGLDGAKSALPVWAEFMKRAHEHRAWRNVQPYSAPDGIVSVDVDPLSGQIATSACPGIRPEYFLSGTQPVEVCHLHNGGGTHVAGWDTAPAEPPRPILLSEPREHVRTAQMKPPIQPSAVVTVPSPEKPKEKRGVFGRFRDIFK